MNHYYVVTDSTIGKVVCLSSDMITAVEEARQYHSYTKNEITIYLGEIVGQIQEEELTI